MTAEGVAFIVDTPGHKLFAPLGDHYITKLADNRGTIGEFPICKIYPHYITHITLLSGNLSVCPVVEFTRDQKVIPLESGIATL
jgi:hypothetical protein